MTQATILTAEQESALYKSDLSAWARYQSTKPAEFATKAEADAEARRLNAARKSSAIEYGTCAHNGGWNIAEYSND